MENELQFLRDELHRMKLLIDKAADVIVDRSIYYDDESLRELAINLVGYHTYLALAIEKTDSELRDDDKKYLIDFIKGAES